ncbi:MAG: hypothetical protein AAF845_16335 [Bacteroidota bacterium]
MHRLLTVLALGVVLVGCDSNSPDGPPEVIAPAAFAIDLDAFPDDNARVAAGPHFLNATVRVGVVTTIIGLNLVLPEAATRAATQVDPVAGDDGETFVWENTVDAVDNDVEIRLLADASGSRINWRLTVENTSDDVEDGPLTLYTASTSFDGQEGTWRLFDPDVDAAMLTAEFDVDDTPEVTFAVPEGRPEAGTSVRYETDGAMRTFDFVDADGVRTLVEWDTETNAGFIEADDYNGGARACWDAGLANTACESV